MALESTATAGAWQGPPMPSILRFNSAGERVPEQTLARVFDAEGNWKDVLQPATDTSVALAVIEFWGPAVDIEIKSPFSPPTVTKFSVKDWDTEGRDDEQRLAFLGELVRQLWDASKAASDGALLPDIKKQIVATVIASHWTKQPQETRK